MGKERSSAQIKNDAKDRFILRFHDDGLRDKVKELAAKNRRSMNAELLLMVEQAVNAAQNAAQ